MIRKSEKPTGGANAKWEYARLFWMDIGIKRVYIEYLKPENIERVLILEETKSQKWGVDEWHKEIKKSIAKLGVHGWEMVSTQDSLIEAGDEIWFKRSLSE